MGDGRAAKMRKLFGGSGLHENTTALAKTLQALRGLSDDELRDVLGASRKSLLKAVHNVYEHVCVDIQLPLVGGAMLKLGMVSWSKALPYFMAQSANYKELMRRLWQAQPCSQTNPYTLLLYADETVPGNVMNLEYPRKSFVASCAVKELGPTLLTVGALWMPLVCVRTNECKRVTGGVAAVWTEMLRQLLLVENIATNGFPVEFGPGEHATLFFRVGNFMLDGDALRQVYGSKGGRPKLPCLGCLNVTSDETLVGAGMVGLTCADPSLFVLATDEDLWHKADQLQAAPPGARAKLSTSFGLNYVPQGFLWCHPLRSFIRPTSTLTYDAMHVIYSNGIADDEYTNILPRLLAAGVTWHQLRDYFTADWHHAKVFRGGNAIRTAFSDAQQRHYSSAGSWSFTASQHLCIMPIFLHFLETVVNRLRPGVLAKEIASFRALAAVSLLVRHGKSSGEHVARLRDACTAWAQASALAYGIDARRSHKAHWLHHLPSQVARDGWVLDCFVGERNQSVVKEAVRTVENTSTFEVSVLSRVLSRCLSKVEEPDAFCDHLLKPQACPELGGLSAPAMRFGGQLFAKDDIILHRESLYLIVACALFDNHHQIVVRGLEVLEQVTPSSFRCVPSPGMTCIAAEIEDKHAQAWYWVAGEAVVLVA